ncbi:helix-turn-helix domain-containing protein [Burkholderia pseudomallei]|uniref:helix-turn-helix domain-containing protein n=1 Tax=Burkholderia pseudomallei TaxID=28450 RepID=UPI00048F0C8C|nr:helix-turn-helix domain-containing protein [Burkholderia pseudomallei]AJX94475.1 helix-turn-helix family protein [Burkholderia pseudomallei PB08298010]MCW0080481.1 helix-turn-helix domain-containing protein [Burkholderia pseudomallei]CAJ2989472.1 DNA-binding protein [Burkholderia pseudomallei]CAJ3394713.1 DNA-binding protein [Burkholderia pseudomallei]CAJ7658594.1 DNA-binding protein [Burkholderia pseudomallei]
MTKVTAKRNPAEGFNPVPHTVDDTERLLAKRSVKAAYDELEDEYSALGAILAARQEAGLTQAQVAKRMGTTASAVSRLEASLSSEKHSPSFATLRRYAAACGKRLVITFA